MGTDVYTKHGLHIRRIALGYGRGPGYQIHIRDRWTSLTEAEFYELIVLLLNHMLEMKK